MLLLGCGESAESSKKEAQCASVTGAFNGVVTYSEVADDPTCAGLEVGTTFDTPETFDSQGQLVSTDPAITCVTDRPRCAVRAVCDFADANGTLKMTYNLVYDEGTDELFGTADFSGTGSYCRSVKAIASFWR